MQTGIRAAEYLRDFGTRHEGLYTEEETRTICKIVERLGTGPAIDGIHEQLNQKEK